MRKIEVTLDKVREIKFSINAMGELEDRFNKSVPELFAFGTPGVRVMVAMLRIGLKYGGMKIPGKSIEDQELFIGDLIQEHWIDCGNTMVEIMEIAKSALQAAGLIPKDDEEEEEKSDENPDTDTDES
jgi:hypothetical protein